MLSLINSVNIKTRQRRNSETRKLTNWKVLNISGIIDYVDPFATGNTLICGQRFESAKYIEETFLQDSELQQSLEEMFSRY